VSTPRAFELQGQHFGLHVRTLYWEGISEEQYSFRYGNPSSLFISGTSFPATSKAKRQAVDWVS
jgi:hypothetical protein